MAFDVAALNNFNNEVAGELIVKAIMVGSTIEYATVKEGVKYKEPINLFEVDLNVVDGYGCVSTMAGTASFAQRDIEVCQLSSHDGLCLRDLDKKYLGVLQPAGGYNETFTLVTEYADQIVRGFQKYNDQFIWTANTASGACSNGLNQILKSTTAGVVVPSSITGSVPSSTNIGDQIDVMIENLAADVQDREDLTVFMSITNFRKYITWLRNENNYHFDPAAVENRVNFMAMKHPFTPNVTIVGTIGLQGSNRIVLGPAKHIVVGVDLLSDVSNFSLWYDINDDKLKHRVVTKLGCNVAYPEFWVSNNQA
jgi:hypothetical protein